MMLRRCIGVLLVFRLISLLYIRIISSYLCQQMTFLCLCFQVYCTLMTFSKALFYSILSDIPQVPRAMHDLTGVAVFLY